MDTSIFAVISQMVADHHAIDLSQGYPNFDIDKGLIDRVSYYMNAGKNQYAPMKGVKKLREQIKKSYAQNHLAEYDVDAEITITAGATQAIYTAISSMVRENDEVIVFQPAYDIYAPAIRLNGGIVKYCNLLYPEYRINWDEVNKMITQNTRMIIVNTPHNPTGSVLQKEDILQLEKIVEGREIIILSDEVYEHLIFDGREHCSISRFPELASRAFVVGSFGKSLNATGWKMGHIVAPEFLMKEFRKVHQYVVFAVNTPIQYAIADHMDTLDFSRLASFYQNKRDYFNQKLKNSRFKLTPSEGTYFQLLDYSAITDEEELAFAERLIVDYKLASIPLSPFYNQPVNNKQLRFCFAKTDERIDKAAEILCRI